MNKPDGMVIVDSTTQPLLDTARALLAKGVKGELQLWDATRPYCRMKGDIERLAGLMVLDGADRSPSFGKWRPRDDLPNASPAADCSESQMAPIAKRPFLTAPAALETAF